MYKFPRCRNVDYPVTVFLRYENFFNIKCDALIRAEDVAAKEVSLAYREKRLQDDRELMQQHINSLTEDLHSTTEKANSSKRELITRFAITSHINEMRKLILYGDNQ